MFYVICYLRALQAVNQNITTFYLSWVSDGKDSVLEFGEMEYPFLTITHRYSQILSGSAC